MVCANTITGGASTKQSRTAMFQSTKAETKTQHAPEERDSFSSCAKPNGEHEGRNHQCVCVGGGGASLAHNS